MITLTFAGDESGDVSFNFSKGASRYFVVAVIATADPQGLREMLNEVKQGGFFGMGDHCRQNSPTQDLRDDTAIEFLFVFCYGITGSHPCGHARRGDLDSR